VKKLLEHHLFSVQSEEGATITEYALIMFLVALAAVGALTLLGQGILTLFQNILDGLFG
jgi:Flp pilus assembly pilin Flp